MTKLMNDSRIRVATFLASHWLENAVVDALEAAGMATDKHRSATSLVAALHASRADIAVVEDNGEQLASLLSALRFRGMTPVPVLAVGQGSREHITEALRRGATDYAVIGDAIENLVNRVHARAQLARHGEQPATLEFGGCRLFAEFRCLRSESGEIQLTTREFGIAWLLFEHAGRVVNINTLSSQVWGREVGVAKRTIEQHMSRLRSKLRIVGEGASVLHVQAVTNVGYRLALASRGLAQRTLAKAMQQMLAGTEERGSMMSVEGSMCA